MLDGITRRKALTGIGSIAIGGAALHTLTGTSEAAQVQLEGLTVYSANELITEPLEDVRISVDAQYEYNSNRAPEEWQITLFVGTHPDSMYSIATREETETFESDSGTTTLQASLLNAPGFDLSMFDPDTGGSKSVSFLVGLEFLTFGANEVQSEDYLEDNTTVEIQNGEFVVDSDLGGVGNVSVQT